MTRLSPFILLLIMATTGVLTPNPAHADPRTWFGRIVNGLFGDFRLGPSPENTGVAPFAQDPDHAKPKTAPLLVAPEGTIAINRPHLEDTDLVAWATEQVIMGLTLHPNDLKRDSKDKKVRANQLAATYTPTGQADLATFFIQWGGETQLLAKGFELSAFTTHTPVKEDIKNKGVFGEAYRWLVDIPVTITIMPAGQKNYRGPLGTRNVTTKTYIIRVQVGRVPTTSGTSAGAMIERFTVLPSLG